MTASRWVGPRLCFLSALTHRGDVLSQGIFEINLERSGPQFSDMTLSG